MKTYLIYIVDYPEYLTKYPQLCLEYVVDRNKVRRKTDEDMRETCLNLISGKGEQNELCYGSSRKTQDEGKTAYSYC